MYSDIYKLIEEYDKIVLARHVGVDPDAMASVMALKDSIMLTFPEKKVYAVGSGSNRFSYFGKLDKVDSVKNALLIVLDTPDIRRIDGVDLNDLIQEGLVGLNIAIKSFADNKDASFYTYAVRCINNRMISLIVSCRRLKNKALNDSVFLELSDNDLTNSYGKDIADNSFNPEEILIDLENKNEILEIIENCLNENEKQVIYLKIDGYKYKEIADILGKDIKYVDNIIQRIKNKLKLNLSDK